jgi:hypothetical protein
MRAVGGRHTGAGGVWILVTALAVASPSLAAEARATARATIVEPMALRISWPMAMPSVQGGVTGASFLGVMPSMSMGMTMPANARLVIRREDDTGAPVTAPANFEVTQIGPEALVVRTTAEAPAADPQKPALAGGSLQGRAAASIEVARGPVAGFGRAGVQVVVQYN